MKFEYKEIEECCKQLEQILHNMEAIFNNNKAQVKKISSGEIWYGLGAQQFSKKCQKTMKVDQSILYNLREIIKYIRKCSYNYEQTEKMIENSIKKLLG